MMQGTELKDRYLWFDGDIKLAYNDLIDFIAIPECHGKIIVEDNDCDIIQYNKISAKKRQIRTKKESVTIPNPKWEIPSEYSEMDVLGFLANQIDNQQLSEDDIDVRYNRIAQEYKLFKQQGLEPILRVLIFVINTLTENNIVWGVGRGSSVSSYVLYLIGVHDVDSVKYNLNITDFLR